MKLTEKMFVLVTPQTKRRIAMAAQQKFGSSAKASTYLRCLIEENLPDDIEVRDPNSTISNLSNSN